MLRLLAPVDVAFLEATWIAVLGLGVNVASAGLLAGHHGHGQHTITTTTTMSPTGVGTVCGARTTICARPTSMCWPTRSDARSSAIVALLAGRYLGWVWLDPVMGIVGGVVIGRWSWVLMRDTAAVLLDTTDASVADEIRDVVEGPGDARIVDLHVWRIGPEAHAGIVSVAGAPGLDAEAIRSTARPGA